MPPAGGCEHAGEIVDRTRERALHVAEEFALDEVLRQGGAVKLDQRAARATAAAEWIMLATNLFADAALAGDEDVSLRGARSA